MQTIGTQKDSPAWVIQTWAAFVPRFRRCACKCCIFENDLNAAF